MDKTLQDLKMEYSNKKKKTTTEGILEMENLGKKTGTTISGITNRIQEEEKRSSSADDTWKEIDVAEKKFLA